MDVTEIIKVYLQKHGYDGLCNPDLECGCGVDDLQPCYEPPWGDGGCDKCVAARKNTDGMYVPAKSEDE